MSNLAQSGLRVGLNLQPHHVSKGASGSKLSDGIAVDYTGQYDNGICAEMLGVNCDTAQKVPMLCSSTVPAKVHCSCLRFTLDATAHIVYCDATPGESSNHTTDNRKNRKHHKTQCGLRQTGTCTSCR